MQTPEQKSREKINTLLQEAGWWIQEMQTLDITASFWIAVCEFPLKNGHGFADYLLYVDRQPIGIIEAKKEGSSLVGVEVQSKKYVEWLHNCLEHGKMLPFSYESTGTETRFTNHLEPEPKSRQVFTFHTPQRLKELLSLEKQSQALFQIMPPLQRSDLRQVQFEAINRLEFSLSQNRSKALIQMATGTGKTYTFCNIAYRLIKYTKAKRILFLVDRGNLARQALKEFQNFSLPDDGRKFHEVYNIQNMISNRVDEVSKVCISTIQRMYSMLSWKEIEAQAEEESLMYSSLFKEPDPIKYNPLLPIDTFDYIVVDECHRSIYHLWRQILEYFDAKIIGMTATPSAQTIGFFEKNLVMEYNHERAVADGVNVDFSVYKIETKITQEGSKVEAKHHIDVRDKHTRAVKYRELDEDLMYAPNELDRSIVAPDQIRTIIRTFKESLFTEIFPWRTVVPKTLIFAKDDSHAEDIVKIVRDEFGKWNDFCQKITYKTTGKKPEDLIREFRTSYHPRIAVTVDMISTGTDIKPLEIVFFMRSVKSQLLFEQMKGRGVRTINDSDFQAVTPDAKQKTHFVLIDAVWIVENDLTDTKPLDKKPMVAFPDLLKYIAMWSTDPDILSTFVSRLSKMSKSFNPDQHEELLKIAKVSLSELQRNIIEAINPDNIETKALQTTQKSSPEALTPDELTLAKDQLAKEALTPLYNPVYRQKLIEFKSLCEQIIDTVSIDTLQFAGFDESAKLKAQAVISNFERFIEEHKQELNLIQAYYDQSSAHRVSYQELKALIGKISQKPLLKSGEVIWRAYRTLKPAQVIENASHFSNGDYISLLDFTFHKVERLEPFALRVEQNFQEFLDDSRASGKGFTQEQMEWLELMKNDIIENISLTLEDLDSWLMLEKGGIGRAYKVFGKELGEIVERLNGELV